ncbi:uroporphyrinogen-III C-methyltransferase [Metabacillus schmidteae]|uniref:uroporphyrinogen-III C-methyltransferase n=1 Tax=Metabacillus schmidteae TaxID=2730405 RepID=UPI00158B93BD|nr:uroporphyrinogen-III C-methyltransferase [Metabacillus schmidteae]
MSVGKVYLVGAGPGDRELITVKGREAIKKADVILYDRLVNFSLLDDAPAHCDLIYCGKLPTRHFMRQNEINATLVQKAMAGHTVVRLKGGDPSVFGRVGEEAEELALHQIPFEIVPGITSGIAAPLYAGIPVTHRDYAGSFAVVTAHDKSKNGKPDIDWEGLARGVQTIAFYMGVSNLEHICENLIQFGKSPDTPVIIIRWGTWSRQQNVVGTLSTIVEKVRAAKIENPAITLVGDIVSTRDKVKWFENRPLFGKQILYIRGKAEDVNRTSEWMEQGADVIEFPRWITKEKLIESAVLNLLPAYERMLFLSRESVEAFFNQLKEKKMDIRQIQAKLYCQNTLAISKLEEKGLYAEHVDTMDHQGSLLVIGSEEQKKDYSSLDGIHFISVYETSIDGRYETIIKRSLEDASLTTIVFSSSEAVDLLMEKGAQYGISPKEINQTVSFVCETAQARETLEKYGFAVEESDGEVLVESL